MPRPIYLKSRTFFQKDRKFIPQTQNPSTRATNAFLGFVGALALLFNAATGPGLVFSPANFQAPGWIITVFCFLVFSFVSGYSILFIVEVLAMQAIPGNKHFQGDVEYATLINFYFGHWAHIAGQLLLYGALISNAIQAIVLSAQSIDNMLLDLFGKTCGVSFGTGWLCINNRSSFYPSPFENTWMLFTLGLLVVIVITIPLGLSNLDDNMWVQYLAFCVSIILTLQWISTSFVVGFKTSRIVSAAPLGIVYGQVIGTVLLNLAITTIIPSWINIKSKDVNVQKSVWSSILLITSFYLVSGFLLAGGYDDLNNNVMTTLIMSGRPEILTKLMVYLFPFILLIPSVPVNLIISRENLLQNNVMSLLQSSFACFLLPLLVVIPFQTGDQLIHFQSWTSSIFVSPSNFIIPVVIYFRCVEFRSKYNRDRVLTGKQLDILKRIHSKSSSLVQHLRRQKIYLEKVAGLNLPNSANFNSSMGRPSFSRGDSSRIHGTLTDVTARPSMIEGADVIVPLENKNEQPPIKEDLFTPINENGPDMQDIFEDGADPLANMENAEVGGEITVAELDIIMEENVPDPDKEDMDEGRFHTLLGNPSTGEPSILTRIATTLGRRAPHSTNQSPHSGSASLPRPMIHLIPPVPEGLPMNNVQGHDLERRSATLRGSVPTSIRPSISEDVRRSMANSLMITPQLLVIPPKEAGKTQELSPVLGSNFQGLNEANGMKDRSIDRSSKGSEGKPGSIGLDIPGSGKNDSDSDAPSEYSLLPISPYDGPADEEDNTEGVSKRTIERPSLARKVIDHLGSLANSTVGSTALRRLKTLPTHPNFKSPAFRSVPKWMPIRGYHMAWIVLMVTSIVTFGNIIVLLASS